MIRNIIQPSVTAQLRYKLPSPVVKERIQRGINNFPTRDEVGKSVFSGILIGDEFELQRPQQMFSYTNRTAPVLRGVILDNSEETLLQIAGTPNGQMQLNLAWPIIFAFGVTVIVLIGVLGGQTLSGILFIPYIVAFIFYQINRSTLQSEVQRDIARLNKLIQDPMPNSTTVQ